MLWRMAADALVLVHLSFILFVLLGGLLLLRWPRLIWLHLPAVAWGIVVECLHLGCPLTPWENQLRRMAGQAGYDGGFIEHYLVGNWYPAAVAEMVPALAFAAVAVSWIALGLRRRQRSAGSALDHASAASEL